MSDSQDSQDSLTRRMGGATIDDEPTTTSLGMKRRSRSQSQSQNNSQESIKEEEMEEEEPVNQEDAQLQRDFNNLCRVMESSPGTSSFEVIGLIGKKGGATFAPQECVFVFNKDDPDQRKSAEKGIVKKAKEWRSKNPGVTNAFKLFRATGLSTHITAVGGVDYGFARIPVKPASESYKRLKRK